MRTLIALLLCAQAWAAPIVVSGDHDDRVIAADGQDIRVEGNHLNLVITGKVGQLIVTGHHNDILVDEVTQISTPGDHNDIVFKRGQPLVLPGASHNDISRPASTPQAEAGGASVIEITGSANQRTLAAEGKNVVITGSAHQITITGKAGLVSVTGSANQVTIEECASIDISGMGNQVRYRRGQPKISKSGLNNSIT
jgi:hypothetical protein